MAQDLFQYVIGNLFVNIFLSLIVLAAGLQNAAAYTTNGTGINQNANTAVQTMYNLYDKWNDDTNTYSACPSGTGCEQPTQTSQPLAYEPILAIYNFVSILGKAMQLVGLVLYHYMTWGFMNNAAMDKGPTMLFGFIIMMWNLVTWYLFIKFIISKNRMSN